MLNMSFFVITPHSSDPSFNIKKQIVEELAVSHKAKVYFGSKSDNGEFLAADKVMNLYRTIDLFIADLSYERPSCYFEVGFVQALGKKVHLLAVQGTEIHQVFDRYQVKFYQDLAEYRQLIELILSTDLYS